MPDERYRALLGTEHLLLDLFKAPSERPTYREVRERARRVLRHYPTLYDLDRLAARSPDILQAGYEREPAE